MLVQRTLSRCSPLKPSECEVCPQASLVELFLAVGGFLLCTVGLSRSREEGKAPTLKTQLKICQMHPPHQKRKCTQLHMYGYFSNDKLLPAALRTSSRLPKQALHSKNQG